MAITFPNTPSPGDQWVAENGFTYEYDGEKWSTLPNSEGQIPAGGDEGQVLTKVNSTDFNMEWADVAPPTIISSTAPTGDLADGQLWWRDDTGVLYIYYTDADSSQWVQASVGSDTRVRAEVYSSDIPPLSATEGDLWFNTTTTVLYVYYQSVWVQSNPSASGGAVEEAPFDGQQYARQNGDWSVVTGGGGGGDSSGSGADAWANVEANGTIAGGFNVASVVKETVNGSETGYYEVTFATPMPNASYAITATAKASGATSTSEAVTVTVRSQTTTGFKYTTTKASQRVNSYVSFAVFASSTVTPTYTWTRNGTTLEPANAGDSVDIGNGNIELNDAGHAEFSGPISPGDADSGIALVNVTGETGGCLLSTNKTDITTSRTANIGSSVQPWNNGYFAGAVSIGGTGPDHTMSVYEQDLWTPIFSTANLADGTNAISSYTTQVGQYTRIGNMVTATFTIVTSNSWGLINGAVSSQGLSIDNLPYPVANVSNGIPSGTIGYYTNFTGGYNGGTPMLYANPGGSKIYLYYASNLTTSPLTVATIESASSTIIGSITYFA